MNPPVQSGAGACASFYDRSNFCHGGSVGWLMRLAINSLRTEVDRRLAPHGLTSARWLPLFKIANGEAANVVELARETGIDPGAMTRNLARLEADGLLSRVRSQEDRRCVRLEPTEAGRALAREVWGVLADVMNGHLAGFSQEELDQFMALLRRFNANGEALRREEIQHQEGMA